MKHTFVLRITAGICFYFSVQNIFEALHVWRLPMALFTAFSLLLGMIIVRFRNQAIRGILSIVPALCFLVGPFSLMIILPLLACFWYFCMMVRGNYAMPLEDYRRVCILTLLVNLVFLAANIADSTIYSNHAVSIDSLVYTAVFLFLGVFAMRRMQMGAEMSMNWQLRNLLSMIGIPLLSVGAALIIFLVLRYSHQALTVILTPIGRFFIWLFSRLFPSGNLPIEEMSLEEYVWSKRIPQVVEMEFGANTEIETLTPSNADTMIVERAAAIGGWILLGILLILVLVLIWRRTKRDYAVKDPELFYDETDPSAADGRHSRRRKRVPLTAINARQLRRIYKTYLEYRKDKGTNIHASDTSAEILERDREMNESEDAVKLRQLYLAARYGNPSAVTNAQVQEAQACLERIIG